MPHDVSLIATIAVGFGLALILGFIAVKLRLPPLIGYLIAGVLIGPATPGFVADMGLAAQLAEIGVMLLMFGVGLHFSLQDLMAVRRIAIPGALVQIVSAVLMGWGLATWWGWPFGSGLLFGLCLSVASTVVLLKALESKGLIKSINGQIAIGWLVVEDLVMVLVLVLVPAMSGLLMPDSAHAAASSTGDIWKTIGLTLIKVTAFVVLMLVVGRRLLPKILWWVADTGSKELFTLCVIAAALGVAFGAAKLFDVSFALGAFFAGMMLRESPYSHRAADESLPLRDAFAVLFFVSVGMLFDPSILWTEPLKVLAVVAVIVVGKTLAAVILVLLFRYPLNTALTVGVSLAQIGEFSFILAGLGLNLQLFTQQAQSLILAGALISIAINAGLFVAVGPLQRWIHQQWPGSQRMDQSDDPLAQLPDSTPLHQIRSQVVLVGYGRVGRRIAQALWSQKIPVVIVDQNRDIVEDLRASGHPAVNGDAAEDAVLIQAHIANAAMLVIALPDSLPARQMIEIAKTLNPSVSVVIRTHDEEEATMLAQDGHQHVFIGEHELANSMVQFIEQTLTDKAAASHH